MTQPTKIKCIPILICSLVCLVFLPQSKADSLFNGPYDVGNWTTSWTNSDGSVDTSQAPNYVLLAGGNNGSSGPGEVLFSTIAATETSLAFNWTYITFDVNGSAFDPAGYEIGGVHFQLSPQSSDFGFVGSGMTSVNLSAGQSFGFYVDSTDNNLGPALLQVSAADSTAVPEPSSLLLLGVGILMFGALVIRHRRNVPQSFGATA